MDFYCLCPEPTCFCQEEVRIPVEEQDEIILARILGEIMDYEITSSKVCDQCTDGWHVTDMDTGERTRKETPDPATTDEQG